MPERKIKFYLDSGANIHSQYSAVYSLKDLNITEEEWDSMSEEQKEEFARDIAWQRAEWGWQEV